MSFPTFLASVSVFYAAYYAIAISFEKMKRRPGGDSSDKQVYAVNPEPQAVRHVAGDGFYPEPGQRQIYEQPPIHSQSPEGDMLEDLPEGDNILYDLGLETIHVDGFGINVTKENLAKYVATVYSSD